MSDYHLPIVQWFKGTKELASEVYDELGLEGAWAFEVSDSDGYFEIGSLGLGVGKAVNNEDSILFEYGEWKVRKEI